MIQKIADMAGVTPQAVILTLVFFAAAFIILWIKMSIDEKKGRALKK